MSLLFFFRGFARHIVVSDRRTRDEPSAPTRKKKRRKVYDVSGRNTRAVATLRDVAKRSQVAKAVSHDEQALIVLGMFFSGDDYAG